jgi:hypothetical protein
MSLDSEKFQSLLQEADEAFVNRAGERMQLGEEKYGPLKFLTVDTLEEAMQEVLDLSNYARMTYIKLFLLQYSLREEVNADPANVGKEGFISHGEALGFKHD